MIVIGKCSYSFNDGIEEKKALKVYRSQTLFALEL